LFSFPVTLLRICITLRRVLRELYVKLDVAFPDLDEKRRSFHMKAFESCLDFVVTTESSHMYASLFNLRVRVWDLVM